jgi:hypothetical protein
MAIGAPAEQTSQPPHLLPVAVAVIHSFMQTNWQLGLSVELLYENIYRSSFRT